MFTEDKTYSSLGRHIFDVYIQGQRVLKDFNIEDEASGVNIGSVTQLLLVYEYMEINSLACALYSQEKYQLKLDWPTRHRICIGIARGLAYLHEESKQKIVHRDIKATNVLLEKILNQ